MKKIAVFGSVNIDYFVESKILPKAGETVSGENFFMNFGGKGANQAVAAARLGGDVALFGSIGNDDQKNILLEHFKEENVDVNYLNVRNDVSTGAAFIQLCESENRIIIVPGANQYTNRKYSEQHLENLLNYDLFVFQLEVPVDALEYLIPILHSHNKTIILDPAPAQLLSNEILEKITYITPNEHEVSIITDDIGDKDGLLAKYPNKLIVTCGKYGVKYHNGKEVVTVPARRVKAIDTTGAGDTFTGAFAVALSEGMPLHDCIVYGTYAGSLAVMKKGAQSGMPRKHEMNELLEKEGRRLES
ncbi:ribokinase [Oceanobacillus luteolus]|uniref:ribokinase n=1 Tax=Oceanobacillus luteolus TaxID=1274358 RepID=UPI00203B3133|nr:ribokinase [Oceanobacillus luteolus]MCM3740582.1 ribokinase [Oceanobacillus luteolus]